MVRQDHLKVGTHAYALHALHAQLHPLNRCKVGTSVSHEKHGTGKVLELMVDGRTRVLFDSGTEHRYTPASMAK